MWKFFEKLLLPLTDLVRMDTKLTRKLGKGLLPFYRSQVILEIKIAVVMVPKITARRASGQVDGITCVGTNEPRVILYAHFPQDLFSSLFLSGSKAKVRFGGVSSL
jgi:hypothetical protein